MLPTRRRAAVLIGTLTVWQLAAVSVNAQPYTTAQIVRGAASSPQCLDYRIAGTCFWLVCTPFGCSIETSSRIAHNLPDLVVSSYNQTGQSPWVEGRGIYGSVAEGAAGLALSALGNNFMVGGGSATSDNTENRGNLRFKEVDVLGSPATVITDLIASVTGFMCRSESTPFMPYFLSGADALGWRTGIPDSLRPEAWIPGLREIGRWPVNTWGKVFPRGGHLVQTDDAKVAAVAAQRAADIVTQTGQPHVYIPYGHDDEVVWFGDTSAATEQDCEDSGGAWTERTNEGGGFFCQAQRSVQQIAPANEQQPHWQMISPTLSPVCEAFGAPGTWSNGKVSSTGEYGYLYWACYECCVPHAGTFIGSVEWNGCEF